MLPKLYYITQPLAGISYAKQAEDVCKAGVRLIQLRLKEVSGDDVLGIASDVKNVTDLYGAKLVINDYPEIAMQVKVFGVHLGMNDVHPRDARSITGGNIIIGGTANTFERVVELFPYVDYFGIGPFRFTETKKNLAPLLGLDGYTSILQKMKQNNIHKPVYAIGGIAENDFPALIETGIHGIAVSSLLAKSTDMVQTVNTLNTLLNKC